MTKYSLTVGIDPQAPVRDFAELARVADNAGYSALYAWDTWFSGDAYVGLAAAAMTTERIELGPGVAPYQVRHPAMLVNAMATLDNLSGGRGVLTMGSGGMATVGRLTGHTSMAEFREALAEVRQLANGEVMERGSLNYRAEALLRPLPIGVAAWGPKMLEACGQLADVVFLMGPEQPERFAEKIKVVKDAAVAAGRRPDDIKIAVMVTGLFSDEPDSVIDSLKGLAIHYMFRTRYLHEYPEHFLPVFEEIRQLNGNVPYPEGGTVLGQELVTEEMVKYMMIAGSREEVRDRLIELEDLGLDEITFGLNYPTAEQLTSLASLLDEIKAR